MATSSEEIDNKLLTAVMDRNFDGVKAAFEAGANVNGPREQPFPPIAGAAIVGHAGIVDFLLKQGADPDKPARKGVPGERALHIAARGGLVEIVRLLLKRSHADANATDRVGCTPLMVICVRPQACMEVVQMLLEAGADPALADLDRSVPMHMVAYRGHVDLVDMLHSRAPDTLNHYNAEGETPLFMACFFGHKSMVSKLLSLGARQRTPLDERPMCPLAVAVGKDFVGIVRVLMTEGGIRAVGGGVALSRALCVAIVTCQPRIFRLLLTAGGNERRSEWANVNVEGRRLLHHGAANCYPAAVSILLEAGADEAVPDSDGRIPRDTIGVDLGVDGEPQMDRRKEVAVRRMLQRGPAYRARSWAWPCDAEEAKDADGSGDGDTAAAGGGGGGGGILSSRPAAKTPCVLGVRIFRPKGKNGNKLFARLVGRYCAKD